jgi:hypothetical protein
MFLRSTIRRKDGKEHRYWSVVEARRVAGGRVVQRPVLYLGEINSSQELAWRRSIEVLEEGTARPRTLALFPEDRCEGVLPDASIVRLKLSQLRLERPRQWGACWLALTLWQELQLDGFWGERLPASRKGTRWDLVLLVLVAYRLIAPGSEWRLHREWYARSALMDLLGTDETLADIHALYRCHDRLIEHKEALFNHLVGRWRDLFNASFDVLLYDLTSTYFEANPPFPDDDKRRFGYSRDKRSDCVQVVIALIVTPEGLPLAYEVLPGNTADCTTLKGFLAAIERQYGKARRVWVRRVSVPHSDGDLVPAGGATCLPRVLNSWPMKPSGVQLARPMRPPLRTTRTSSAAACSWFGVNMTPNVDSATSKLSLAKGSASASACRNATGNRSARARSLARCSRSPT